MSLDHMINTYLKAKYEPGLCISCETNEIDIDFSDDLCKECYMERQSDRESDMRDSYD